MQSRAQKNETSHKASTAKGSPKVDRNFDSLHTLE